MLATEWNFTWANGRQLVAAAKTGTNITYTYDLAGIRDSKTVNNVTYHYLTQNGQVVRQTWTEGAVDHVMDFIYDNNGAPYAMKYDGTEYYYVLNLQGDVIRIIDTTGASVAEYIYDAWGRPVSATGTMAEVNPIRYRGYYFDSDSGLYYLQSRYYDPEIKRFINADDTSNIGMDGVFAGCNLFAYCANNPVASSDPAGEFVVSMLLICAVAGAIVGGTVGGIAGNAYANSQGYTGSSKAKCILSGIGIGGLLGGVAGFFAAPFVVSATGIAGLSVTSAGITVLSVPTLLIPEYVRNAGSFIIWLRNTLEKSKQVLNLQQVKQLYSLAKEYGVKISADIFGHPNTNWPMPHLHFGDCRVHVAIAKEAINWVIKTIGGG